MSGCPAFVCTCDNTYATLSHLQDNALELRKWELYGPLLLCLLLGTVLSLAAPSEQKPLIFIAVFLVGPPVPSPATDSCCGSCWSIRRHKFSLRPEHVQRASVDRTTACLPYRLGASAGAWWLTVRGGLMLPLSQVVWFGAAVVTINTLLLGGTIIFWQSVCLLGADSVTDGSLVSAAMPAQLGLGLAGVVRPVRTH